MRTKLGLENLDMKLNVYEEFMPPSPADQKKYQMFWVRNTLQLLEFENQALNGHR